jgi:hypothetical protein
MYRMMVIASLTVLVLLIPPSSHALGEGPWECLWGNDCSEAGVLINPTVTPPLFLQGSDPSIDFDDTDYTGTLDASIVVIGTGNTYTDMFFSVNSGAESELSFIELITDTGGTWAGHTGAYFGRAQGPGTAVGVNHDWVRIREGNAAGFLSINKSKPTIEFHDLDLGGTEAVNAKIRINCPTGTTAGDNEDCDMDFLVQAAGSDLEYDGTDPPIMHIDTTDAGASSVQIGGFTDIAADTSVGNYVAVSTAGVLTGVGTGGVSADGLIDNVCSQILWSVTDPDNAGTVYMNLRDHTGSATENNEDTFLTAAAAMTVSNLICEVDTPPGGAGNGWTVTIRQGAAGSLSNTAVTCTMDNVQTCDDPDNSATVAAGNAITISVLQVSTPDDSTLIDCRMCLGN